MKQQRHVVEVHIGCDVLSKDYGSRDAAKRAMQRLEALGHKVRYWANGFLEYDTEQH